MSKRYTKQQLIQIAKFDANKILNDNLLKNKLLHILGGGYTSTNKVVRGKLVSQELEIQKFLSDHSLDWKTQGFGQFCRISINF